MIESLPRGPHFADTPKGAQASGDIYNLLESATANELDPWRYLEAIFEKFPAAANEQDFEVLLPWRIDIWDIGAMRHASRLRNPRQ